MACRSATALVVPSAVEEPFRPGGGAVVAPVGRRSDRVASGCLGPSGLQRVLTIGFDFADRDAPLFLIDLYSHRSRPSQLPPIARKNRRIFLTPYDSAELSQIGYEIKL